MDLADEAQALTESRLENSLKTRKTITIPFSGRCLACEEPVDGERRFCDGECRTEWERERKRKFGVARPS